MRVYFHTFKGLGLSLPLKSVSVGGWLPALLEFQCEGAILALVIFIPLLEAGLHVEGWQSVASLLDGGQCSWDQFFEKTKLRDAGSPCSFRFACLPPFCLCNANIPTCTIVQEAEADPDIYSLLLLYKKISLIHSRERSQRGFIFVFFNV